jgi:hypothetical protein
LFDDCKNPIFPTFNSIEWFYHSLKTNLIKKVDETFLGQIKEHSGDFVFIAKK